MRVMVHDKWKFPGDFFIFDKQGTQINPDTEVGETVLKILSRQKQDKEDSKPQKYRAEVAHNKDINNDGVIGDPDKVKKTRKKKKSIYNWK